MKRRAVTLSTLVYDTREALIEFAKWSNVEARRIAADNLVAELRTALHGHDPIVPQSIMLTMVADMLDRMFTRECPVSGIRLAFDKMIDVFDAEKEKAAKRLNVETGA